LGEEIIDPSTGLSFGFVESFSGEVIVIKNDLGSGKASLCEITNSKHVMNNGDMVKIPENVAVPIYRFYHNKNKDHFYTKNSTPKGDWTLQGIEFC
jgi:tRNA A37 threonylcarbamoyladenosine biosynthesis protein TsaE